MDRALSTAIVGAIVNVVLSTLVPCLLKNSKDRKGSLITEMKVSFMINRHLLITSSLITAIAVYLAVKMEPELKEVIPVGIMNFLR
tara:strand:- start:92 stop:349 length:258 start_codon:yes stop_codon:yes gene_type:complete